VCSSDLTHIYMGYAVCIVYSLLIWFESYLSKGIQYVKYNNNNVSKQEYITYSIIGPFLLYVNDLSICVNNCKTLLFADDIPIYKVG